MTARFADRYAVEFLAGWGVMDANARVAFFSPRGPDFLELPLPRSKTDSQSDDIRA